MDSIQLSSESPKLCECGCGQPTHLAKLHDKRYGHVPGKPNRFLPGHYLKHLHRQPPLDDKFWSLVLKTDGCWLWQGSLNSAGYGRLKYHQKFYFAHRLAYMLAYGEIMPGVAVCHRCDNPRCVRPDHLFLGTTADNNADRERKGRTCAGQAHKWTRLTPTQVREIRHRYAEGGITKAALAREYHVWPSAIGQIIRRKCWADLPD